MRSITITVALALVTLVTALRAAWLWRRASLRMPRADRQVEREARSLKFKSRPMEWSNRDALSALTAIWGAAAPLTGPKTTSSWALPFRIQIDAMWRAARFEAPSYVKFGTRRANTNDRSTRAFAVRPAPSARRYAALGFTAQRGRASGHRFR